jgi:Ni,Fe-hydrogenase maturation factor
MKILIFGNPLLKEDSIPIKLIPKLKSLYPEIEFKEIDPTENLESEGENLIILDTCQGIKKTTILESIDQLHTNKVYSMHDFDLAYNLKLLKKIGKIKSVKIIAIPMDTSEEEAIMQTSKEITKLKSA